PESFDTGTGTLFDYPDYLGAQGIEYELSLAQAEVVQQSKNKGNPIEATAIWTKETFQRGLVATLPEPEAGLAAGITVGDKRSIGSDLSAVFQKVGLVHVVVLSGYNITVVLSAAARLVQWAPRTAQFGVSGFIVAFFVLMAGGAGSATRAGIMALVAVLARATRRQFLASRALALAALVIVLWNPFELVFDPSFQLSALATLGLIIFSPLFASVLGWIPEKFALREIVTSTISTQLAVLPLLLYQNGQLPLFALPANLFALAAVPTAMFFSLVAGAAGIVLGSLAVPLAFPAYVLLAYIIDVAQFFAALPFSSVAVGQFNVFWMCAAYVLLFASTWLWYFKKSGGRA
ncbi:MAG TPA: ComEC/Rec2 family competence protein, partial [Candidatus Paceibacterota bacterium]|nr:ComEC/Rec2 family competence protein [Candidatus Paceibacterota bacterium]